MNDRKPNVLGTPSMLASLFLDHRQQYYDQLTTNQNESTKIYIVKVWLKIS